MPLFATFFSQLKWIIAPSSGQAINNVVCGCLNACLAGLAGVSCLSVGTWARRWWLYFCRHDEHQLERVFLGRDTCDDVMLWMIMFALITKTGVQREINATGQISGLFSKNIYLTLHSPSLLNCALHSLLFSDYVHSLCLSFSITFSLRVSL